MRKIYGDSLRKDAGFVKVMKSVASKNAKRLESSAGKHAPELRKVARDVIGKFDKVYEEAADAVEDFMSKCEGCIPVHFSLADHFQIAFSSSQNIGGCTGNKNPYSAIERETCHPVRGFSVIL
jgi:hypothetical protein